jgi:hypothetical protein
LLMLMIAATDFDTHPPNRHDSCSNSKYCCIIAYSTTQGSHNEVQASRILFGN